ncbi:MAG TPA: M14 family zinc carboxypeptidase [Gemmatimonadales bacterium]
MSRARVLILAASMLTVVSAPALCQVQRNDEAYTDAIHEFTTEPFFTTPYVDHLPASETVPTPLDVLGHISGAADILSYPEEVYRYMRAVAEASPRVEVLSIGQTEEGREMILVIVADEATMADLDRYKDILARLADPRVTPAEEAEALIAAGKPIYWSTGAIHSPETGSPEMFMELVYRLAVEETPFIQAIRNNVIFMTTPIIEVDGRAKQVDVHMAKRKDEDAVVPGRLLYWGKYVAHDNNRDGIGLSLALSRNVNRVYHEFHPTIFHDHHESASHLYTSTGRGPYNAWFDPIVINEWNTLAYQEVREMTALGVPGVYTHNFYDGWAPNYMFSVAHMHNSIGRFYETQGAGDGAHRIIRSRVEREWHRPNTPLPEVVWSIRNNVNLQQSGLLIALNYVAQHKEDFLRNFYRKGQRSIGKAHAEGPAAYVLPADDTRPMLQARLLRLLDAHGVEIHRADREIKVAEQAFPAGSYVIRMDQPYSRAADMLLDKQYYNPDDPSPYDDVGWTLGPLFNVRVDRVEDTAVLDARMTLIERPGAPAGQVTGDRRATAWAIDYRGQGQLAGFRYANPDLRILAAEEGFEANDRAFAPGAFLIPGDGNAADVGQRLAAAADEYGFTVHGLRRMPSVPMHPVETPRVAVVHTWSTTQTEGWLRSGLDEYGIPYDYISVHELRDDAHLRDKYDVIVMGPSTSPLGILNGVDGDEPIPWKRTELTPNLGANDATDDMRGGLELSGLLHLQDFVEHGGVFVAIANTAELPMHFGLAEGVRVKDTPGLWARGGVFRVDFADAASPVTYGYDETLGVYFNSAPVFALGGGGGGFGFFGGGGAATAGRATDGSTTARRTGRGGLGEADIVQGRPRDLGAAGVEQFREEQADEEESDDEASPVTVLASFPGNARDLLISGGLRGGQQMTGAPALVDVRRGDGHMVLFSFNPFWRGETHGSYALVLNTLLHWNHLNRADGETVAAEEGSR